MEDALALIPLSNNSTLGVGLNPCCNGRCTRTFSSEEQSAIVQGLNPCCNGRCTRTLVKRLLGILTPES